MTSKIFPGPLQRLYKYSPVYLWLSFIWLFTAAAALVIIFGIFINLAFVAWRVNASKIVNIDEGLKIGRVPLKIAKIYASFSGICACYLLASSILGQLFENKRFLKGAEGIYKEAIGFPLLSEYNKESLVDLWTQIALVYHKQGRFEEEALSLFQALSIARAIGITSARLKILARLSYLHRDLGMLELSEMEGEEAIGIIDELSEPIMEKQRSFFKKLEEAGLPTYTNVAIV